MKHEINSQNTKTMLADTLVSLLEKKPISKITVSEIVNLCDINRKTFYYHFTDVYDLLEWHLDSEIQKALNLLDPLSDMEAIFTYSINYMNNTTYLRNCIDTPLGRDKVVQFLNKNLYPKSIEMITNLEQRYEKSMAADFKEFLAKSLTHITVLSIIDAIENPNGFDIKNMKLYLSDVFEASVDGFFQRL